MVAPFFGGQLVSWRLKKNDHLEMICPFRQIAFFLDRGLVKGWVSNLMVKVNSTNHGGYGEGLG